MKKFLFNEAGSIAKKIDSCCPNHLTTYIIMILVNNHDFIKNGIKNDILGKITFYTVLIMGILSLFPIIVLLIKSKVFRDVFSFFGMFSFVLYIQFSHFVSSAKDKMKGIEEKRYSLFSNIKEIGTLDLVYVIVWLMVMIILTVNSYATNIYPYINRKVGGGKTSSYEIILDDEKSIRGELIHQNNERIVIDVGDRKLDIINWNNIDTMSTIKHQNDDM